MFCFCNVFPAQVFGTSQNAFQAAMHLADLIIQSTAPSRAKAVLNTHTNFPGDNVLSPRQLVVATFILAGPAPLASNSGPNAPSPLFLPFLRDLARGQGPTGPVHLEPTWLSLFIHDLCLQGPYFGESSRLLHIFVFHRMQFFTRKS